ncbi:hypothetical protein EON66_03450 [archaeon]|nr:MAG: hypothetical protein EON66_03450 [archaeon]
MWRLFPPAVASVRARAHTVALARVLVSLLRSHLRPRFSTSYVQRSKVKDFAVAKFVGSRRNVEEDASAADAKAKK